MLEIFIPTKIKNNNLEINRISNHFLGILNNSFNDLEILNFSSTYFEGIKIISKKTNNDLIILCNGEFGENYFIDYDIIDDKVIDILGVKIIGQNKIGNEINKRMLNIAEITGILNSNKLLTHSKKKDILKKIEQSFFTLSGIIFLLYSLKEKVDLNIKDLNEYSGNIEYEGQALLLKETSITKMIELKANIDKLECKIEMFIGVVSKLI